MKPSNHRQIALFLAFLILISTTGIGLTTVVCQCTGQSSLAFLSLNFDKDCCHKTKKSVHQLHKNKCCKKNHPSQDALGKQLKGCCDSNFEYFVSDIQLSNPSYEFELSTVLLHTDIPLQYFSAYNYSIQPPQFLPNTANKAPPKLTGKDILIKYQVFRC